MARTRNAGRPAATQSAGRRNPSRTSRAPRCHPRASKRPFYDESTDSDEESDAQTTDASAASAASDTDGPDISGKNAQPRCSPRKYALRGAGLNSEASSAWKNPSRQASARRKTGGESRRNAPVPPAKRRRLSPEHVAQEPRGFIPDWRDARIPFGCWTDIFFYAAGATDGLATGWLVHAATTCRAFAEPALTALYRCPPIRNSIKAKRLGMLLARPASEISFNYRAKVEALHVDIHIVPQAALYQLIHPLGRLKELIVYTPLDQPPYRELDSSVRWHYPHDLFRALEPSAAGSDGAGDKSFPTLLKSWEWSGRLIGGCVPTMESMARVHQTRPFSQLTKLSLANFQVPSLSNLQEKPGSEEREWQAYHEDGVVIEAVAHAISQLASLNHLVVESSTVMNDRLLPLLPKHLVHLELINCWEVKSDDLARFLRTHGGSLGTLTLLHNQSLDLGFLTDLAETCPHLRELHMNLSYYRHHDCVNDADPMYDQALLPGQVPQWPSSLRVINMEHVRDLSVEAAEMCLQSLIDRAADLPNLRYLAIKTMLDIPWQARAALRGKWREKMERVFLRPWEPPRANATLRTPAGDGKDDESSPVTRRKRRSRPSASPSRRSGRIAAHSCASDAHGAASKSLRRRCAKPSYRDPDTDKDDAESSGLEDGDNDADDAVDEAQRPGQDCEPVVQGRCNTVNILFDNQKVRELQYGMDDFLGDDDDESEDEWDEWDGDYDEDESVVFR